MSTLVLRKWPWSDWDVPSVPSLLERLLPSPFLSPLLPGDCGFSVNICYISPVTPSGLESVIHEGFDCEFNFSIDEGLFIFLLFFVSLFVILLSRNVSVCIVESVGIKLLIFSYHILSTFMIYYDVTFKSWYCILCPVVFFFLVWQAVFLILSKNLFLVSLVFLSSFHLPISGAFAHHYSFFLLILGLIWSYLPSFFGQSLDCWF